ncbi:Formin-binding protein 4 [Amphibalanus amphitrite]|uniref:Formin-binding protein 4 n=1 Tax=Amphibalanus amphitrite TaxID=1232801 RepID=A0A6A4WXG7_AMPAM|nr:Formin-binding protein 4 [Amphibalanus amphitrite]
MTTISSSEGPNDDGSTAAAAANTGAFENNGAEYPNEWQPCVDETSGYTYYWNPATNEVSWEPPVDISSLLQPPPPPPPPPPADPEPTPKRLMEEGIQLITSYGGDSTEDESEDEQPAPPPRKPSAVRRRSPPRAKKPPSPQYGPRLPSPEYGPKLPSAASPVYGPAGPPSPVYGPALPPAAEERSPSPEAPAPARLTMGPFGTTAAAFVGPVLPPHLAADLGSGAGSAPGSAAASGAGSAAASGDEEEEAELLAQLRERAAQLRQLGGELPSGVEKLVTDPEPDEKQKSKPTKPEAKEEAAKPEPDLPVAEPELDILAAIEAEVPPDAEQEPEPAVSSPTPAAERPSEDSEPSDERSTSSRSRKRRRKARSRAAVVTEDGPPAKESRLEDETSAPQPADDLMAMIEAEQPPDYEQSTSPAVKTASDATEDPTMDIISAIESEMPPDYEPAVDSPASTAPAEKKADSPNADSTLDIISAIENELPPDYEGSGSGKANSEENYTTFSAGAYETPTLQVQDGTCVGLGYHEAGPPDRLAWEEAPQKDRPRRPAASDKRGFVQFQKGGTLEPAPEPAKEAVKEQESAAAFSRADPEDADRINDMVEEIVDKLEFLGVGLETVSPVKVLAIQTQTLCAAWQSGDLRAAYFLRWLEAEVAAFAERERDSAPDGWTMQWHRTRKRYTYTNLKTGREQNDYPDMEPESGEFVHCLEQSMKPVPPPPPPSLGPVPTPPPGVLKKQPSPPAGDGALPVPPPPPKFEGRFRLEPPPPPRFPVAPPPPSLSSYEPPPPGEEPDVPLPVPPPPPAEEPPEPQRGRQLLSELDSFYSEVGLLNEVSAPPLPAAPAPAEPEPPLPPTPSPPPPQPEETAAAAVETADRHKKKKKKGAMTATALIHKKKGVDKLVAKWKTVQKGL